MNINENKLKWRKTKENEGKYMKMNENESFEFAAQPMSNYTAGWVEPRRIYIILWQLWREERDRERKNAKQGCQIKDKYF